MSETTHTPATVADEASSASTSSCCSTKSDCCSPASDCGVSDKLALLSGSVLLRVWLGVRAIQSGIEKFATYSVAGKPSVADGEPTGLADVVSEKSYSLSAYKGIPDALKSTFADQPMIPGFMLPIYNAVLGPALLILGVTVLLGIASRISLLFLGLLYVSLTWGLILLGDAGNAGVAWLGTHVILIVLALQLTRHDPLRVLKKW